MCKFNRNDKKICEDEDDKFNKNLSVNKVSNFSKISNL